MKYWNSCFVIALSVFSWRRKSPGGCSFKRWGRQNPSTVPFVIETLPVKLQRKELGQGVPPQNERLPNAPETERGESLFEKGKRQRWLGNIGSSGQHYGNSSASLPNGSEMKTLLSGL
jgi:hypothetical protein